MSSTVSNKLLVLLAVLCGTLTTSIARDAAGRGRMLEVSTQEEEGVTHFYVQNPGLAAVTVTFKMRSRNLKSSVPFPCTMTLAGNQTLEAFNLAPIKTNASWSYKVTHSSVTGSAVAVHDDDCIYSLPYAPGSSFLVSQGYHGRASHTGPDEYSIDWKMPIGTPVHAARGGLVVKSKDDSDEGGPSRKYEASANCVYIQHEDGTIGVYGHLQMGGNQVKVGDQVKTGDFIALSGNTGFTHGPHLHFSVFKAKDGWERQSLPVRFRSADQGILTPMFGQTCTAAPLEPPAAPDVTHLASRK